MLITIFLSSVLVRYFLNTKIFLYVNNVQFKIEQTKLPFSVFSSNAGVMLKVFLGSGKLAYMAITARYNLDEAVSAMKKPVNNAPKSLYVKWSTDIVIPRMLNSRLNQLHSNWFYYRLFQRFIFSIRLGKNTGCWEIVCYFFKSDCGHSIFQLHGNSLHRILM